MILCHVSPFTHSASPYAKHPSCPPVEPPLQMHWRGVSLYAIGSFGGLVVFVYFRHGQIDFGGIGFKKRQLIDADLLARGT